MGLASLLMALLTLFYCALLKVLKSKCGDLNTSLKQTKNPICADEFFVILNNLALVNKLCGYHTLFMTPGTILEYMQGGYFFVKYAYLPPIFTPIEWYKVFFHAVHLFFVLYILLVQVFECSWTEDRVSSCKSEIQNYSFKCI